MLPPPTKAYDVTVIQVLPPPGAEAATIVRVFAKNDPTAQRLARQEIRRRGITGPVHLRSRRAPAFDPPR